jgi:hypothetical protein
VYQRVSAVNKEALCSQLSADWPLVFHCWLLVANPSSLGEFAKFLVKLVFHCGMFVSFQSGCEFQLLVSPISWAAFATAGGLAIKSFTRDRHWSAYAVIVGQRLMRTFSIKSVANNRLLPGK